MSALTLLALALRLEGIGTWYWLDEALSVGIARHDLADIPHLLLRDGSPPLWYLLLHVWTQLFGASATATHALSAVFAVVMVPLAWASGRRLVGPRAAWFAAALATVSPFITYFGRETRMYSLVAVLGVLVAWSFVAAFVDGRPRARWVFAAALLALLYTHNWGLYTGLGCGAALVPIWIASDDRRALVRSALPAFGVVGLGYLPWLPALVSQVHNTGAPWSFTPSLRGVVREVAALFRDERVLVGLVVAGGVGLLPLARAWRTREGLTALSLAVITLVPIGIGWGLSHVEPSWATRYLAVVVGPLILLLAAGLARAGTVGVVATVLGAVLVIQPITRLDSYPLPRDAKSNGRAIAALVGPRVVAGDLVVVAQPEAVPLVALELGPSLTYADPTGVVEDPSVMDWRDAEARLDASSYEDDVAPLIDATEVGDRVAVIVPGNATRPTDTSWITSFRLKGRHIVEALRRDPDFRLVDRHVGSGREYVTLNVFLFERISR